MSLTKKESTFEGHTHCISAPSDGKVPVDKPPTHGNMAGLVEAIRVALIVTG